MSTERILQNQMTIMKALSVLIHRTKYHDGLIRELAVAERLTVMELEQEKAR